MLFTSFAGMYTLAAIQDNASLDTIGWDMQRPSHAFFDELYLLP